MATPVPDGDTRARLIVAWLPLVGRIARRFRPSPVLDRDDLVSAGTLGLLSAAGRWDAAWGVSFGTFASHRIRGAIIDEIRRLRPGTRHDPQSWPRSLDQALGGLGSGDGDLTLADQCADPRATAAFSQAEAAIDLAPMLASLPPRERRVLVDLEVRDRLLRVVAGELGVTESRVSQLRHRARRRLRTQVAQIGAA